MEIVPDDKPKSQAKISLFETLLQEFATLPKSPKAKEYDNYVAVNVGPAIVPNPYIPSFRIFSYNTSTEALSTQGKKRKHGHRRGDRKDKETHCRMDEYKDSWKCHLDEPWFSDPNSPSRRNQRWSPLGYAQVCFYIF